MDDFIDEELAKGFESSLRLGSSLEDLRKGNPGPSLTTNFKETPPKRKKKDDYLDELIREYITWVGFDKTKEVFIQEAGLSKEDVSRQTLTKHYDVKDTEESADVPLLLCALSRYLKKDM